MKVLKFPEIPIQICIKCGAELKIRLKDLKYNNWTLCRDIFKCKVCKKCNTVKFKDAQHSEQKQTKDAQ